MGHLQPNDMGIVESAVWKEELDAEARWRQGKVEVGQRERGEFLFRQSNINLATHIKRLHQNRRVPSSLHFPFYYSYQVL